MEKKKAPSEVIQDFLDYLDACEEEYNSAYETVGKADNCLQDFVHELEFAPNKAERNKVATKFQASRRNRRQAKDRVVEYEKIHKFYTDPANKPALKRLKQIVSLQKQNEDYLTGERHYNKRGDETDGSNSRNE